MDHFLLHLKLLNDILEKKIKTLTQILNIIENQKAVLSVNAFDKTVLQLYVGMMREKQRLIDSVNKGDKVFEKTYREISAVFETQAPRHAGLIRRMQEGVRRVTALDTRIRVLEARKEAASLKTAGVTVTNNLSARKRMARIYEKNNDMLKKKK